MHFFCFQPKIPFLGKFGPKKIKVVSSSWKMVTQLTKWNINCNLWSFSVSVWCITMWNWTTAFCITSVLPLNQGDCYGMHIKLEKCHFLSVLLVLSKVFVRSYLILNINYVWIIVSTFDDVWGHQGRLRLLWYYRGEAWTCF